MRAVRYHPAARTELLREAAFLATIRAGLAERFGAAVRAAERLAAEHPEAWPAGPAGTRRVIDRRFGFALVYLHDATEIHVIAVAPTRRRVAYWRGRVAED